MERNELKPANCQVRIDGKTPSGGVYSIAYYFDADGFPTCKENASIVHVVEYDKNDRRITETYGTLIKSK